MINNCFILKAKWNQRKRKDWCENIGRWKRRRKNVQNKIIGEREKRNSDDIWVATRNYIQCQWPCFLRPTFLDVPVPITRLNAIRLLERSNRPLQIQCAEISTLFSYLVNILRCLFPFLITSIVFLLIISTFSIIHFTTSSYFSAETRFPINLFDFNNYCFHGLIIYTIFWSKFFWPKIFEDRKFFRICLSCLFDERYIKIWLKANEIIP